MSPLVERHGGSIEVGGEVEESSTFNIILPTKEVIA